VWKKTYRPFPLIAGPAAWFEGAVGIASVVPLTRSRTKMLPNVSSRLSAKDRKVTYLPSAEMLGSLARSSAGAPPVDLLANSISPVSR